ncbi:MAG TPA: hypothetical protein VEI02_05160, partial [Planctomycetota bacterium]|nr:hypothetical protein [Planctomycetota bacterium]
MLKTSAATVAFVFAASVASAQIVVNVDDVGCQDGFNNVNALTGGVPASASVSFDYNSATQRLTLVVSNTSPVIAGQHTPLITRILFNAPELAVTSMSIVSQT